MGKYIPSAEMVAKGLVVTIIGMVIVNRLFPYVPVVGIKAKNFINGKV